MGSLTTKIIAVGVALAVLAGAFVAWRAGIVSGAVNEERIAAKDRTNDAIKRTGTDAENAEGDFRDCEARPGMTWDFASGICKPESVE